MEIFKNDEPFYLKSLVLIFKEDNFSNRISEIVYICINLYLEYLKNSKNKNFSAYYYNEALDLIKIFRNKINESNLKNKLLDIEKICQIEKDKILIENENKQKSTIKNITNEEALSAIDQYTYVIENYGTPDENTPIKEKEIRAYLLAKLVHLELNFLNYKDLKKLKKMTEESLSLADACNLTNETDPWVQNLIEMKEKITKKINEQEKNEFEKISNTLNQMMAKDINGDDDKENIEFLKMLDSELIKDNKNKENIEEMYKNDPEKLINRRLSIINKIPDEKEEVKVKKSKLKKILNKLKNIFKRGNKKKKK